MATAVFDTLQASRKLKAAGISETHAEAIVSSMSEAFSDTVATKADIAALEATTKSDIAEVKAEIANLRAEMFRALWIQGGSIVALIVGLLKFT
ncbi:MAG: hypothetical protein OXI75_13405 [Rhodospirillales bacterium]|nr:hypothetical protein [Rhodospirillales bacterium]